MATSSPIKNYGISDLKSLLLQPALTTHYEVHIPQPKKDLATFIGTRIGDLTLASKILTVSCSDASLPGSSLATHELNNDITGVTQRHAYRRLYDDRADFTFYVNHNYTQIMFFEKWMQFISGENTEIAEDKPYRVKWPNQYKQLIYITKFERTVNKPKSGVGKENSANGDFNLTELNYTFLNAYPISISSIPVSYESASLLKCTVSFTYDKYVTDRVQRIGSSAATATQPSQPSQTPATGVPDVSQGSNYFSTNQRTDFNTARNTDLSGISIPTVNTSENQFNKEFTTNTTTTFRQEPLF